MKKMALMLYIFSFLSFSNNTFKSIDFTGDKLEIFKVKKVVNKYLNKEINSESLTQLLKELENHLREAGYVTTSVKFKEGNAKTGKIILEIVPGKIDDIKLINEKGEDISNEKKLKFAFGNYKNKILNINDLDQGIENLNVRSSKHFIKIIPSEKEAYVNVEIIEKKDKEHFLDISIDNNTSVQKAVNFNIAYEKTNLFNANDSIKVGYITELHKNLRENNKNIFSLNYTIPYAKSKFEYDINLVLNNEILKGEKTNEIFTKNTTLTNAIHINTVLKRDKVSKLELNVGASLENNKLVIQNQKIEVASKNKFGFDAELSYSRGNFVTKAIFEHKIKGNTVLKLRENYTKNKLLTDNVYLKVDLNLGVNIAKEETAAGINTVRGFKENALTGKYLAYSKNTLGLGFNNKNKYLSGFNPYVGLDLAVSEKGNVVGGTVGLNYAVDKFKFGLSYSRGLKLKNKKEKAENILKFNVAYTL